MDVHLVELLKSVGALGAASGPIFLILWWRADNERQKVQAKYEILVDRAVTAIESSKRTQSKMALLLGQADRADDD